MAKLLSEGQADNRTKEIYAEIKQAFGLVPNIFKAQAAADPQWLELNWARVKQVLIADGALDRKTKELLAMAVSLMNRCDYCFWAHEHFARKAGASEQEVIEAKQIVELFMSFNAIADALRVPMDGPPKKTG